MVRLTLKRSLRAASCWRVEVMKGGAGWRFFSRVAMEETVKGAPSSASRMRRAAASSGISTGSWFRLRSRAAKEGGLRA